MADILVDYNSVNRWLTWNTKIREWFDSWVNTEVNGSKPYLVFEQWLVESEKFALKEPGLAKQVIRLFYIRVKYHIQGYF